MTKKISRSIICVTAYGDYRQGVMDAIHNHPLSATIELVGGTEAFDPTIKVLTGKLGRFTELKNIFIADRRILWQKNGLLKNITADNLVIDLNPRVLNVWLTILVRKLIGKRTVLWGHAWSRNKSDTTAIHPRNILRILSDGIIVYTKTQQNELIASGYKKSIWAAPNALYNREFILKKEQPQEKTNILYVGRLVAEKKPTLLLDAYNELSKEKQKTHKLIYVGDGPEIEKLKLLVEKNNLQENVFFMGHINNPEKLREIYSKSLVSVSPGYVGLSITQSFAFGTPMIIARHEAHSPEIEAAIEYDNSLFFNENNPTDLAEKINSVINEKNTWVNRSSKIKLSCAENYSAQKMATGIINGLLNIKTQ